MENSTPPWGNSNVPVMEPEIVEGNDKGKLKKVRLPKIGSDPQDPETFMQIAAHSATHGETIPQVMQHAATLTVSQNLLKKLAAECPFVMQDPKKGIITSSEAIANVLIQKAVAGDLSAIKEVLNRSEGKVPNVTLNESKSLRVNTDADGLAALFNSLDKNK